MTKKSFLFISSLFLFALCLIFREECALGVREGIDICISSVIPALFPFLVLSSLIVKFAPPCFALASPLITGLLCGFPIGAKGICDMYLQKRISKKDAEMLLFSANNCGCPFIIGFIGKILFEKGYTAWILFFSEALFAILIFIITSRKIKPINMQNNNADNKSLLYEILQSIKSAAISSMNISSFIIFFTFFEKVFFKILSFNYIEAASFSLFFELTSGIKKSAGIPNDHLIPMVFAAVGFGGASVHLQSMKIISDAGLDAKNHFFGKLILSLLMLIEGLFLSRVL